MGDRPDILTAVSGCRAMGVAALAIMFRGGRLVCSEVVEAEDIFCAQVLAILREVEITSSGLSRPTQILTDSELLLPCLAEGAWAPSPAGDRLVASLRDALAETEGKATVAQVPRPITRAAYIVARQTRNAWLAGANGALTTWAPKQPAGDLAAA